jgi:radical SAM superfamily enzyme YgiQ (UPF0313 family)
LNLPWEVDGRDGIRAGCRFPNLTPRRTNRYVPFPFLLAHAASYLESRGVEVLLIDGCAERSTPDDVAARVAAFGPDLIVAETSTTSLAHDRRQLAALAARTPDARIAVYGPHTDVRPEDALAEPAVDYVLLGEPEHTSLALLDVLEGRQSPAEVPGLVWRAGDGAAVVNRRRPVIADLDALPFPRRAGLPMARYAVPGFPSPVAFLYAGRGCPYRCSFCLWPQTTLQGAFRPRAPERIVDEMNDIVRAHPGTRSFFFDDDTFNLGRDRMLRFADELERRGPRLPWGCNARADHWDAEVLNRLAQVGLFTLRFGIESGDPEVLARTGKGLDLDEARRTLEMAHRAGIQNHIMFVVGLPGETQASVTRTLRYIESVPHHSVQFSVATPFPGTQMFREAAARGHLVTGEWQHFSGFDHVVMRTDALSAEEVGRQLARARRRVYFSPRFIGRRLRYVRDLRDLPALARKAWRLLTSAGFDRV